MTAPRPIALELLTEAEAIRRIHGRDSDVRAGQRVPRSALDLIADSDDFVWRAE